MLQWMQLENLLYIYAESKSLGYILHKVFDNDRRLNQIKVDGKQVSIPLLIDELESKYNGIRTIWDEYNQYIHPSSKQNSLEALNLDGYFSKNLGYDVFPKRVKKELYKDMIFVNKVLVDTLYSIIDKQIAFIKKHKLYTFYKQVLADCDLYKE